MAEDIGIELHDKIKQAFDVRCGKDSTLSHIKRKIENGTATMEDTSVYARRLGELLRKSIESTTKPDDLPGEKMYFNIAQSILEPLLRNNYDDVNTICEEVQSALDAKKGIGLKPQKADFPAERIRAAIGGAAVKETAEHAIQVLGRTAENITGSFQTDYIKKNAEFRSKAGLNCYIERKDGHNCCDWCSKLAGKYRYPDEVPKDVYRRHDNCTCDVSYVSEKGRQNVHSKQWANEQAKAQRIAYAASLPKPMKLTKAEAIAKESEILAQRQLTYEKKRGIIKNIELPPETNQVRSMSAETKILISDAFDKLTAEYDIRYDELVTEGLSDEHKNVPFQFQPIRGEDGELIKRFVINSNYDFMGSQANFQERILRNYNNGILASNSIEGLISHELAHIMTFQDTTTFSGYLLENKNVSKKMVYGISRYADASNDGAECIAEAFAAKRCGSIISKEAQALLDEYIERWRKT